MEFIKPQVKAPMVRIAEGQEEFRPVTGARVSHPDYNTPDGKSHNTVLLTARLSDAERALIIAGADLYISLLTFGGPMQAVLVMVGREEAAEVYALDVDIDTEPNWTTVEGHMFCLSCSQKWAEGGEVGCTCV